MSLPALAGVFAKINRAREHAQNLEADVQRFLDEGPYRVISEEDPETGECLVRAQVIKEPPLVEWGVRVGDVLFNYRSALDQLAWQLALVHKPDMDPPERTEFPIFVDVPLFEKERAKKIGGLSTEAQDTIERLQPYNRGGTPEFDPLWSLHELNRIDKHRVLLVTAQLANTVTFWVSTLQEMGVPESTFAPIGAFEHDETLARLPPIPRCSEVAEKLQFSFEIALAPVGPLSGYMRIGMAFDRWDRRMTEVIGRLAKFFAA